MVVFTTAVAAVVADSFDGKVNIPQRAPAKEALGRIAKRYWPYSSCDCIINTSTDNGKSRSVEVSHVEFLDVTVYFFLVTPAADRRLRFFFGKSSR